MELITEEFIINCVDFVTEIPFFMFASMIYLLFVSVDCLHTYIIERKSRRKTTFSGNLSSREYYLLDKQFKECKENFTDENLKILGELTFAFTESERQNKEDIKEIFNKLKFWKKEK